MMKWKDRVGDWDVCGFLNDMILTILLLEDEIIKYIYFFLFFFLLGEGQKKKKKLKFWKGNYIVFKIKTFFDWKA